MGRRSRGEWPEPWIRLRWSDGDVARIARLNSLTLAPRDRLFIDEMQHAHEATLQQVAWLRTLSRRYKVEAYYERAGDTGKTRRIIVGDD